MEFEQPLFSASSTPGPEQIEVGVSTMHQVSAGAVCERLGLGASGIRVLIVNQCPEGPLPPDISEGMIRMYSFRERGLSRSRNRVLQLCRGEILVFADDDLCYAPDLPLVLTQAFAAFPDAAAITFPMLCAETGSPTRRFPSGSCRHTFWSIGGVATPELAVRPRLLGPVRFDEGMGLGTPLPQGEEQVFLSELLHRGHVVGFFPRPLCRHRGISSGQRPWSAAMVRTKAAVLRRLYPRLWPAYSCALWLIKYPGHGRELGLGRWTAAWLRAGLASTTVSETPGDG